MHDQYSIYLGSRPAPVDLDAAATVFESPPGRAAVLMDLKKEAIGSILLPDEVSGRLRPDVGTVLTSGHESMKPGDRVIVSPYAGKWMEGVEIGAFKASSQVRFYGSIAIPGTPASLRDIFDDIMATLSEKQITCLGGNILVRRPSLREKEGSIYVPDASKKRAPVATVVSAGPDCTFAKPGMQVLLLNSAVNTADALSLRYFSDEIELEGSIEDYAFITENAIMQILTSEEAA